MRKNVFVTVYFRNCLAFYQRKTIAQIQPLPLPLRRLLDNYVTKVRVFVVIAPVLYAPQKIVGMMNLESIKI